MVVSTIKGITVEISEGLFATAFGLPTEGLTDVSDVPKDLVFDARSLFSESEEQVSISCFKKEMKIEYRLLHDILAKTLFVKAGSFDVVTRERFMLMTAITFDVKINWGSMLFGVLKAMVSPGSRQAKGYAIKICVVLSKVPGLELGESNPFPIHRVLTERTVHRFVHINEQIGMEKAAGSTPVKKTVKKPVTKKRPAASETEVAPISKKKRTTKGKPAAMALEAVPLQTIPAELPPVPKRKSRNSWLVLEQEDDLVVDEPVEESATGVQETSTDVPVSEEQPAADPDDIIEQILIQLDTAAATQGDKIETWFDRTFDQEFTTTEQEKQYSEEEIDFDVSKTGEEASSSKHHPEELMSLNDLLIQISEDTMLPSVTAAEITKIRLGESINIQEVQDRYVYYASLPRISIHDKGKEPLVKDEPVKGNPARESVELICGDVEFLVRLRDQVMVDVVEFFHYFSLNKLPDSDSLKILKEKEKLMLEWAGTDSLETAVKRRLYILAKYQEMLLRKFLESRQKYLVPGQPWTATASQIIDLLSVSHSKSLEVLITQQKENGLPIEQPCTSTYLDTYIGSGVVLAQFFSQAKSKCWVRPMVKINGLWTPIQGPEFLRSSCKLSLFVNKRPVPESVVEENFVPHGCVIEPFQYWGTGPSLLDSVDIQSIQEFESASSDGSTVYRSPSPILQKDDSFDQENLYFVESPVSPPPLLSQDSTSSSSDSQMNFDDTDTAAPAPTISKPGFSTVSPDITEAIHQLRTSLDQISNRDNGAALKDVILLHLHDIEKKFTTRLDAQDRWFGTFRTDSNDQRNLLSLEIKSSQRQINTQIATATLDQIDMQREGEIGSSSRCPPPVRVERRPLPTPANQGESSSGHGRVLSVEEAAEMVREAQASKPVAKQDFGNIDASYSGIGYSDAENLDSDVEYPVESYSILYAVHSTLGISRRIVSVNQMQATTSS
ncbi:hypothetical protein F511_09674 [Dorcoceras hygrometricum]|uniref:Uncharacterized protein n=1 Tax=Dorcoceras hygrometricum TaxID=472368 RepID=A0A2Z7AFY2_9LAMI|nr:hypothetical protein F511_09674 [Dorcoceras hygrometricum]